MARSRSRALFGTVVVFLVVAACLRLGFWQLDRLAQRRDLNQRIASRQAAPPLADPALLTDTAANLYRRIRLTGRYDEARSIAIPGRSLHGLPGVHLLTPLQLDGERAVLVNRGWLPSPDGATVAWDSVPPAGAGRVAGLVLPLPTRAPRAGAREPAAPGFRRAWYRLDPDALGAQYPYRLAPALVQLLPDAAAPDFPVRLAPPPLDEGPHLSYAVQWFAFAAIGLIGWAALVRRSRADASGPRPPPPPPPL